MDTYRWGIEEGDIGGDIRRRYSSLLITHFSHTYTSSLISPYSLGHPISYAKSLGTSLVVVVSLFSG